MRIVYICIHDTATVRYPFTLLSLCHPPSLGFFPLSLCRALFTSHQNVVGGARNPLLLCALCGCDRPSSYATIARNHSICICIHTRIILQPSGRSAAVCVHIYRRVEKTYHRGIVCVCARVRVFFFIFPFPARFRL